MFFNYVKDLVEKSRRISQEHLPYTGTVKQMKQGFPSSYSDLTVRAGFGMSNWANITWIALLGEGQKVSDGIYPVYLYYRELDILILAYGISATNEPQLKWNLSGVTTIGDYFKQNNISAPKNYNKSFVYKVYRNYSFDQSMDDDLDAIIRVYKQIIHKQPTPQPHSNDNAMNGSNDNEQNADKRIIQSAIDAIKQSGLIYSDHFISRFILSLMTKPFVILSGLSGSGKTQLAIAFAKAMCDNFDKQARIVPVGADWTNREPLLGYPNALEESKYVQPDSRVLQLILEALGDPDRPYFLILDEMNLSYVERYFSDFLSALESKEKIPLWDNNLVDAPQAISLPENLFIIGTINVDETTYMFSPKVLDRANVIEFIIDEEEMDLYLSSTPTVDFEKLSRSLSSTASDFVKASKSSITIDFEETKSLLLSFFSKLKSVNAEFGYRSASEIGRFISLAKKYSDMNDRQAIDAAILQKLLPKLHGSRKKLVPILSTLWNMCGEAIISIENADCVPDNTDYPLTANKLLRMYRRAVDNGFTSFAEA